MLRELPATSHPDLLIGPEHFSDAGVFRLRADLAIVQTTDFFPPLVDDPFTFGQIAAANSLSDCYAMGATPITCLNIVGFPDKDLPLEILDAILAGGASKVAEAGAVILGGHSVRDAEIKYGLAVTGTVHPDRVLSNRGAQPGDVLILTKPIGSGILASAAKNEKISQDEFSEAITVMTELNAAAARVAVRVGAHAVTDITGFGLIGHAFEMAEASGVTVDLFASRVPLMKRARELAEAGTVTRAWKQTLESLGAAYTNEGADAVLEKVVADAQTSGGLLLAVAAQDAERVLAELRNEGLASPAAVGEVRPKSASTLTFRP
ncbi:Selenide, water dikinase [Phycisphaerae bacterium RAS2]|nr:Selenide, water dikinase [Phycisphaerae bacterium RAS2]